MGKTISGSNAESVFAVHPHARGEDTRQAVAALGVLWFTPTHVGKTFCFWCYIIAYIGSPPRTWGRLVVYHDSFFRKWFTPTHVGKTAFAAATNPSNMVHPHARGEDAAPIPSIFAFIWFTPTHVGKTRPFRLISRLYLVHPHARGEDTSTIRCL